MSTTTIDLTKPYSLMEFSKLNGDLLKNKIEDLTDKKFVSALFGSAFSTLAIITLTIYAIRSPVCNTFDMALALGFSGACTAGAAICFSVVIAARMQMQKKCYPEKLLDLLKEESFLSQERQKKLENSLATRSGLEAEQSHKGTVDKLILELENRISSNPNDQELGEK